MDRSAPQTASHADTLQAAALTLDLGLSLFRPETTDRIGAIHLLRSIRGSIRERNSHQLGLHDPGLDYRDNGHGQPPMDSRRRDIIGDSRAGRPLVLSSAARHRPAGNLLHHKHPVCRIRHRQHFVFHSSRAGSQLRSPLRWNLRLFADRSALGFRLYARLADFTQRVCVCRQTQRLAQNGGVHRHLL